VSPQEGVWATVLSVALMWAFISALVAAVGGHYELRGWAWAGIVSFVLSSLVAAYSFWRLP
jgi:hypothetical protein